MSTHLGSGRARCDDYLMPGDALESIAAKIVHLHARTRELARGPFPASTAPNRIRGCASDGPARTASGSFGRRLGTKGTSMAAEVQAAAAERAASARGALERRIAELERANRALLVDFDKGAPAGVLARIVAGTFRATVAGGGDAPGAARGAFVWDPETQTGLITVENLPPIPPNYDYEIWLADAGQPVPVGTFHPTRVGRQTWPFKASARIGRATEFMVTRERRGGTAKIEGPALLVSDQF